MALGMSVWSAVLLVLFIIIFNSLIAATIVYLIRGRKKKLFWKAFLASAIIWVVAIAGLIIYLRLTIGEFL